MIHEFTTERVFPPATVLGAYSTADLGPDRPFGRPVAAPHATATVNSQQFVSFEGLFPDQGYWVGAQVAGAWKWLYIHTRPSTAQLITAGRDETPLRVRGATGQDQPILEIETVDDQLGLEVYDDGSLSFGPAVVGVNVNDPPFNADPTGETDSTNAFQAAHDYLASLELGAHVIRRVNTNGSYLLNGPDGTPLQAGGHSWCVSLWADNIEINAAPGTVYHTTVSAHTFLAAGCMKGDDPLTGDPMTWRDRWINDPTTTDYYNLTGPYVKGQNTITLASSGDNTHFEAGDDIFIRTGICTNGGTVAGDAELNRVAWVADATIGLKYPLSKPMAQEYYFADPEVDDGFTNLPAETGVTTWPALFGVANVTDRVLRRPVFRGGRFESEGDITTTVNPGGGPRTPWPIYGLGTIDAVVDLDPGSVVNSLIAAFNVDRGRVMDLKRIHYTGSDLTFHTVVNADTGCNDLLVKPVVASCEFGVCGFEIHEGCANVTIEPCTLYNQPGFSDALPVFSIGARFYDLDIHQPTIYNSSSATWAVSVNDALNEIYTDLRHSRVMAPRLVGNQGTQGIFIDIDGVELHDPMVDPGVEIRIKGATTAAPDSGLHVVGATDEPAYETGWEAVATGGVGFMKLNSGVVHIEGTVQNTSGSTMASGSLIFTLPAGYRPVNRQFVPYGSGVGYTDGSVSISRSTGQVTLLADVLTTEVVTINVEYVPGG